MNCSSAFRSEIAGRAKVLMVDDDRLGTEVRSEIIMMNGFFVNVAFSGPEALSKASCFDFNIFVIDYDMPGMSGLELARELRRQGQNAPIVMLSGRLEPPNEPGAELLARFISKGQGADALLQALLELSQQTPAKAITAQRSTVVSAKVGT